MGDNLSAGDHASSHIQAHRIAEDSLGEAGWNATPTTSGTPHAPSNITGKTLLGNYQCDDMQQHGISSNDEKEWTNALLTEDEDEKELSTDEQKWTDALLKLGLPAGVFSFDPRHPKQNERLRKALPRS